MTLRTNGELRPAGPRFLQLEVEQGGVVSGLRAVLLDHGEDAKGDRQVSVRESSSSADRQDNSIGATMAWPNSNSASLSVLCSPSSEEESVQQAHIARRAGA